jgi:hypothetical protein
MAGQNAMGQTALHTLARSQAMSGTAGSRFAGSQQLGLSGMLGNSGLQQAFQQAMGLAGQRASVWAQQPFQTQPNYNMAAGFQNAVSQGLLGYSLAKGQNQAQAPTGGSYVPPNWGTPAGTPPTYNPGGYNPGTPLLY